ncbi:amidohydrolase family-domain-containing protein [Crucibulum laeve]|uniref:Amidohydrolase family-domain-containing protein n=1 Tax=Crucibulum laeve TaxID=68775 RepID=A0A5C3MGT1_9AGAR|nr:amidohydrolase family-domain-containing protein [Crucibulum laeve]
MSTIRQRPNYGDHSTIPQKQAERCDNDRTGKASSANSAFLSRSGMRNIFLAVLGLSLCYRWLRKDLPHPSDTTYAICSKEGNKIYTVDEHNTQQQCVVVHRGYIVETGSLQDIKGLRKSLPYIGAALNIRYIPDGSIVVPGISDSHGHILEYGASQQLPLEGTKTIQDTVARVREFILSNPDVYNDTSKFIMGGGWDHTVWPSSGWPSAADLDADPVIRGRPVILQSKDCHALWVSLRAIESSLPFPEAIEGGVIVRDDTGSPTGLLLDNAQDLLKQPKLTESDLLRRFKVAVKDAHSLGLTSIHDAGLDPISLAFFKRQAELGTLPIRIYGMTYFNEDKAYWGNTTTPVIGAGNGRLTARSVKIFADGALRTGGAALYEPYTDNPSTPGFMRLDSDVLFDVIPKFLRDGWQVNVHAIGDRANGIVLDAFEASLVGVNVTALRPRLEHAQMMTKADMARLGRLGVIASVQPTHAISDMWYAQDRLGPERVKQLYAFRSLIDSGARITLGSDFPVESMNPLSGFYAAITRVSPDGKSPHGSEGWFPEQRLTRTEALRGMTIDPAYASFTENTLGSLEIGKRADYVVLSQDIMTVPANKILSTEVLATAIDGDVVHGSI